MDPRDPPANKIYTDFPVRR